MILVILLEFLNAIKGNVKELLLFDQDLEQEYMLVIGGSSEMCHVF